jgi:hypothetical protein
MHDGVNLTGRSAFVDLRGPVGWMAGERPVSAALILPAPVGRRSPVPVGRRPPHAPRADEPHLHPAGSQSGCDAHQAITCRTVDPSSAANPAVLVGGCAGRPRCLFSSASGAKILSCGSQKGIQSRR